MPLRWNVDHQHQVVDHNKPGVPPGRSYEFTDEELAAGITGNWAEEDPRKPLVRRAAKPEESPDSTGEEETR